MALSSVVMMVKNCVSLVLNLAIKPFGAFYAITTRVVAFINHKVKYLYLENSDMPPQD